MGGPDWPPDTIRPVFISYDGNLPLAKRQTESEQRVRS